MRQSPILALIAALALAAGSAGAEPLAALASQFAWQRVEDEFGGFSSIEVSADGRRFTALTDRGSVYAGLLVRDAEGRLVAVEVLTGPQPLKDRHGQALSGRDTDAEGLALAQDGGFFVSFESNHRVAFYAGADTASELLPEVPGKAGFHPNGGLEALAIDAGGALYALPETPLDGAFPVLRYQDGRWDQPFTLPETDGLLPVGADFGPDGALYLLERDFAGIFGFQSRLRRFRLGDGAISEVETLFVTDAGTHDNLEGIAVWQAEDGALWLTLISDDNFTFLQRTDIVEYRIAP